MSKQDRQGVRTASELEQKHNFGKRFAEIMGVATGAQKNADELEEMLGKTLTPEEIFNILTDNGKTHGLFRGEDGELYINAQYIVALEYLFANDIEMSGKFTYKTKTYLPPEMPELKAIQYHMLGIATIPSDKLPLYDFNNDGKISTADALKGSKFMQEPDSFAEWSKAEQTEVTMTIDLKNPQKAIRITGTNMWGREIDSYMGVQGVSVKHTETTDYVVGDQLNYSVTDFDMLYCKKWFSGTLEMWGNITLDEFGGIGDTKVLRKTITLPSFSSTEPIVGMTIKDGTSLECLRGSVPTYSYNYDNNTLTLEVLNTVNSIIDGTTVEVSVFIKGKWK